VDLDVVICSLLFLSVSMTKLTMSSLRSSPLFSLIWARVNAACSFALCSGRPFSAFLALVVDLVFAAFSLSGSYDLFSLGPLLCALITDCDWADCYVSDAAASRDFALWPLFALAAAAVGPRTFASCAGILPVRAAAMLELLSCVSCDDYRPPCFGRGEKERVAWCLFFLGPAAAPRRLPGFSCPGCAPIEPRRFPSGAGRESAAYWSFFWSSARRLADCLSTVSCARMGPLSGC